MPEEPEPDEPNGDHATTRAARRAERHRENVELDRELAEGSALRLRLAFLDLDPHRIVYATIILLVALSLYDEGDEVLADGPFFILLGISFAPLFALAMAHAFSDALDLQIRHRRRLTRYDRRHLLAVNLQYLYVGVPVTLLLGLLTLLGWHAEDAVGLTLVLGILSLVAWGVLAAAAAHLPVWRQITFGLAYGVMGTLVLVVELVLTH